MTYRRFLPILACLAELALGCAEPPTPCAKPLFLRDPESGSCLALSPCFLTAEQRSWVACSDGDPCASQSEAGCLADARCQPVYSLPDTPNIASCRTLSMSRPAGVAVAGQTRALHSPLVCDRPYTRVFSGCRVVPALPESCANLDESGCAARPDCVWNGSSGEDFKLSRQSFCGERLHLRPANCQAEHRDLAEAEAACLLNAQCQPTGTACYCPPGAACPCDGGSFVACEHNHRSRTCEKSADCQPGEFCRTDRDSCQAPRTGFMATASAKDFSTTFISPPPLPSPCVGVCARDACDGLSEQACQLEVSCTPIYERECDPPAGASYGFSGGGCPLDGTDAPVCSCRNVFQRCIASTPSSLTQERSLLVLDPAIVSDFALGDVVARLAPAGEEEEFLRSWLSAYPTATTLPSGAHAEPRFGMQDLITRLTWKGSIRQALNQSFHATALVNRLDLMTREHCGEARLVFAYNGGYDDAGQRMTVIIELRVPDDGQGCRTVAQRWAELSLQSDPAERLQRLHALFGELLKPERLAALRSDEFVSTHGSQSWDLRQWGLDAKGRLVLVPAQQTVDQRFDLSPEFTAWVAANLAAVQAGTVEVPVKFLAAASPSTGRRVRLLGSGGDAALGRAERRLAADACSGCHLQETGSAFVHIGERLSPAEAPHGPVGRAVVSAFLRSQLPLRMAVLKSVLAGGQKAQSLRLASRKGVH